MGLRNGSLVCSVCWQTLFAFANFQKALQVQNLNGSDPSQGYTYNTQTWKEIEDGENLGCNWCNFLWGDILEYRKSRREQHLRTTEMPSDDERWKITVRFRRSQEMPHNMTLWTYIGDDFFPNGYEIHARNDDPAATLITGRNIIWEVASAESYRLSKECIEDCVKNHTCQSSKKPQLPTRVVDCSDPKNPRLYVSSGRKAHFTALSYVWGQAQPHSTYSTNIESYLSRIDISVLPQTIVDAITATHSLGLRYLWTDALCIIQDSPDDKNRELPEMCNIYQNAYVTIIAACSKKAGDGFLHNRRNPVSTALPFWLPSGELGTIHVRDQERAPQNEPVNQRAWCFQERVLSSRALIYASHTVQFQCYSGIKNIGGGNNYLPVAKTDGLRIPIDLLPTGNAQSKWSVRCQNVAAVAKASNVDVLDRELTLYEQRTWRTWKDILAEYTRRSITNPADKLVALAGVAEAIQRRWLQKSEYLAGLWYQTLAQDLIWHRYQCADRRSRPQGYRAPSWSWAATDGPISDGAWPGIIEPVISFQSCTTLPAISSLPFGEIRGGTLVAKAIVRCVSWGQNSLEANEAPLYELCNGLRREVGFVYHDCAGSEPIEGFAVVVGEFNKRVLHNLIGLVVVPVEEKLDTYTRVGLFNVHQQITDPDAGSWANEPYADIHDWMSRPTQLITVI